MFSRFDTGHQSYSLNVLLNTIVMINKIIKHKKYRIINHNNNPNPNPNPNPNQWISLIPNPTPLTTRIFVRKVVWRVGSHRDPIPSRRHP